MIWGNDDLLPYIINTLAVFHFSKFPLNALAPLNTASQQQTKRERREREVVSKRCGQEKKNETTWGNDDLLARIDCTLAVSHFSKVPLNEVTPENTASQ